MKPRAEEVELDGASVKRFRSWIAGNPNPSISELESELGALGSFASWRGLDSALALLGPKSRFGAPTYVAKFVAELAASRSVASALDPFATSPTLAAAIAEQLPDVRATAITPDELVSKAGTLVAPSVQWVLAGSMAELDEENCFDFIASAPPLGAKLEALPVQKGLGDSANSLLVDAAEHLNPGGALAFVMSDAFFFRQDAQRTKDRLAERGLRVEAAISIASQAAPYGGSQVPVSLMLITEGDPLEKLFVGRLDSLVDPTSLIRNMTNRTHGDFMQLGLMYPMDRYRGWRALTNEVELLEEMGRLSLPIRDLGEIALKFAKQAKDASESQNSIYVPEYLNAKVLTDPPDNPNGYTRVDINAELASARWVAQWLNEPLGQTSRASLAVGATIERLLPKDLDHLRISVPSLETQNATVSAAQELKLFAAETSEARSRLWSGELKLDEAQGFVSRIQLAVENDPSQVVSAPTTETWIEHLPFPLAGIGRRYLAVSPVREKVDHLQHFFEAYAILMVTVLLSALRRDAVTYQETVDKISETAKDGYSPLDRADFGTWINLGRTMAKRIRTILNDDKSGSYQSVLFGNLPKPLVESVTAKGFWRELDSAREIRNERGHGGIEGERWLEAKLSRLETLLTDLRASHARIFLVADLVRPGSAEQREDGRFDFDRAERLMGSNWTFQERKIESTGSMRGRELYFVPASGVAENPLRLLPLVQLRKVPESEERAVYFYNRKLGSGEGNGFRFVSYNFEGRPEEEVLDQSISRLLLDLTPG